MIKVPTTVEEYFALSDMFYETLATFNEASYHGLSLDIPKARLLELNTIIQSIPADLIQEVNTFKGF